MKQTKKTVRCPNCHAEIRADAPYCLSCGVKNPKTSKPFYKKWWVWAIAACVVIGGIAGGGDTEETPVPDAKEPIAIMETVEPTTEDAEPIAEEPETEPEPAAEPEPNTSEKVDALALEAKAAVAEGVTDGQRDEAVTFLVDHYPDYYTDNSIMEQAMAYGFWLEYAYQDDEASQTYAELGMDVSQAVKYVYRGAETVEDDATQENLRQIQEHLETLGLVEQPVQQEVTEPTTEAVPQEALPTEQPAEQPQQATQTVTEPEASETMVWIPQSGSKYHSTSTCSNMKNPSQVTISEAKSRGYEPCSKCH
ncbi:zinc ribbon domain-containing protein [Candidatus Avoscillospira sp. LCP25S3_F1]|uniref:zinc ribbon domain-containing protein n=1 Tax=Candidatus Avoscillospira sp. LCP25S3_F1 TaxID=3438825 RepID=UPI003F8EBDD8